jgi:hypothetical protein
LLEKQLETRALPSKFRYSDVIKNLWVLFLSGEDCAKDIQEHLKSDFLQILNLQVCSPDTIGHILKNLVQPTEVHIRN